MNTEYTYIPFKGFAQASGGTNYGEDDYGVESYGCVDGQVCQTVPGAPNTGFLGLSQDTAIAAISGGALLLIAIVAAVIFAAAKSRKRKNNTQE